MFFKKALSMILSIIVIGGSFLMISANTEYPDQTENHDTVGIIKSGYWIDRKEDLAEVKLTATGLDNVITPREGIDIMLLIDNSLSMPADCNHPKHVTYASYSIGDKAHKWSLAKFQEEIVPLLKAEAANPEGKIKVTENTWDIDPELIIPLSEEGWVLYPGVAKINSIKQNDPYSSKAIDFWHIANLNKTVHGWKDHSLHYQPAGDGYKRVYNTSSTTGLTNLTLKQSAPYTLYTKGDCISNLQANYKAIESFVNELYKLSPESHVAISVFNGVVGTTDTTPYTAYSKVGDEKSLLATYKKAIDTILAKGDSQAYTNYEAGFRSISKIMKDDLYIDGGDHSDCESRKLLVFFTDGWPNSHCVNGNMGSYKREDHPAPYNYAKPIVDGLKNKNVEIFVATAGINTSEGGNLADIEAILEDIATGPRHRYKVEDYGTDIFNSMYSDILKYTFKKKHFQITDLIDNRYAIVDEKVLAKNVDNKFHSRNTVVKVTPVTIDGVDCQEVVFDVILPDSNTFTKSVKIPLIVNSDMFDEDTLSHLPLNYDPNGTDGGADIEYVDNSGKRHKTATRRVFVKSVDDNDIINEDPNEDIDIEIVPEDPTSDNPNNEVEEEINKKFNKDRGKNASPQTGDQAYVAYAASLMLVMVLTAGTLLIKPKKEEN